MTSPVLSKSLFLKGRQCLRRLWLAVNLPPEPEIESEDEWEMREAEGAEVERSAESLVPGIVRIAAAFDDETQAETRVDFASLTTRTLQAIAARVPIAQGHLQTDTLTALDGHLSLSDHARTCDFRGQGRIRILDAHQDSAPRRRQHGPEPVRTRARSAEQFHARLLLGFRKKTGEKGALDHTEQKVELRYALADWGKIWGNPTLYEEYALVDGESDVLESKLLLGDELAPGWHWGTNLVWERQLSDPQGNVFELTAGLSDTLMDERLSLGGEFKLEFEDDNTDRATTPRRWRSARVFNGDRRQACTWISRP